jgi:hypothetical protein
MITTPWTKFFYEYLLEDEQDLSVGEMLTVYFGTPNMFITLWFGFDYGTNPPLGTLIIVDAKSAPRAKHTARRKKLA